MILEDFFQPLNKIATSPPILSLSGKYTLVVETYKTSPNGWDYTRGIISEGANILFQIDRNYPNFWFSWNIHPNGNEYFLAGRDYQSLTIINMTLGTIKDYPLNWSVLEVYPYKTKLALVGCEWGNPRELRVYPFNDPDNFNPEDILLHDDNVVLWDLAEIIWVDERTLKVLWREEEMDGNDNDREDLQSLVKRVKEYDPHIPLKVINDKEVQIVYQLP